MKKYEKRHNVYTVPDFDVMYTENGKIKFLEPKFKIGDIVKYAVVSKDKLRKILSICYIEGVREFQYWIEGIRHAVDEDLLT